MCSDADIDLVQEKLRGLRPHLYKRDEDGRRELYVALLGELTDEHVVILRESRYHDNR